MHHYGEKIKTIILHFARRHSVSLSLAYHRLTLTSFERQRRLTCGDNGSRGQCCVRDANADKHSSKGREFFKSFGALERVIVATQP